MTTIKVSGAGFTGVLRLTWVHDELAHVLKRAGTDEPTGTWTGLACPDHGLAIGADVDTAVLAQMCKHGEVADVVWEAPDRLAAQHEQAHQATMLAYQAGNMELAERHWQDVAAIWSGAWAANCAALGFMQETGLDRFAPVKPQRWVVASFEHHCGPHSALNPHVHNIVVATLTTGTVDR